MNLRQKAKRFKRLYEQGLLKKPYPVEFRYVDLQHYKTQTFVERWDDIPMYRIEDKLIQNIRDILKDNIKLEEDTDIYDRKIYSLDIWMEK